jgi:hypothetical protein
MSADALLYYGYYLGSPEGEGWRVEEADRLDALDLPWMALAGEDHENGDYDSAMTRALLAEKGVQGVLAELPYGELTESLAWHCGVLVLQHGHPDVPHYSLAAARSVFTCTTWRPAPVTPVLRSGAHQDMLDALKVLGITPLQSSPSWMLATGEH